MFERADIVKLVNDGPTYMVLVRKMIGNDGRLFAGTVIYSEFENDIELRVGEYDKNYIVKHFEKVGKL